ncbi:MAG: bifunctional UDP-N-acetylmuramoyl-tripeptide:D-alanyl-D-alanine ligase/alanine racemase [Bacteroidota bacterium]
MPTQPYTINEIASILGGKLVGPISQTEPVRHLLTDSRKMLAPSASLFFAMRGDRRDGHEFIPDLHAAGVRSFVVSRPECATAFPDSSFIVVSDALVALQKLAAHRRSLFSYPVIAITGSNGKTIVKEWLFQLLRDDFHIVRSPKSYNSQIGVPLSVWDMQSSNDLAIFEAGISEPGEMEKLGNIIRPDIGIFTNLGSAHDEHFSGMDQKALEKLRLFKHCKKLIYCRDYLVIADKLNHADFLPQDLEVFTWSKRHPADLQIGRITRQNGETEIQGIFQNRFVHIRIPFSDDASIENAIHCWALMLMLQIDHDVISERMLALAPVAMRLEMKDGISNCSIINDSYNSDIGSLTIALDFLNQQKQHPRKTIILSDILQSGKNEEALYTEVGELLEKKQVSRLIGIGPAISRQANRFNCESVFFNDTDSFLSGLHGGMFSNETILLKGARSFGFERIVRMLQQKAHETVLEINLNAVVHNLNFFKSRLRPDTAVMVMVKAFSYGSGSFEIANLLQFHRVDYLAVAYADEGVELRKAGITLPIMVMSPEEQSFDTMVDYKLEPEIYSFRILNHFSEAVKRRRQNESTEPFPIHLKLDTGMRRLGFTEEEVNELVIRIGNLKHLKIATIFTHLAASDESNHDAFTKQQTARFTEMSGQLCRHFNYSIRRHVLNSAGILRFPEYQFEMVRLGIGLHGVAATMHEQKQLEFVSTLRATISQIKIVKAQETVGYSRKGKMDRDAQIATVGIGYADGLNRRLSNGKGNMVIAGKKCPIVGNICMDMTMIDVTGLDVHEGDEVIVFGPGYTIIDMAKDLETIPYEVLTSVSQRVKRVYFHE